MHNIISFLSEHDKVVTTWTSIAALLISTISIIVAITNMILQRRHNRKSVLPIGHIAVGDYENKIFVRLWNYGVGPMIVGRVTVTREGDAGHPKPAIISLMPALPGGYPWTTFVEDISNRAIPAKENITLVSLEGDEDDKNFVAARQLVRTALSRLSINVEYKNIYGEKMPPASRNLDWFGRHAQK